MYTIEVTNKAEQIKFILFDIRKISRMVALLMNDILR